LGTIQKPDIYIQFYDGANWIELVSESIDFSVRDGGLRKSPIAHVRLHNPSSIPELYDLFRINVDIRGVQDQIFYGRIFETEQEAVPGSSATRLSLTALGLEGAKLLREFITHDYQDEQDAYYPYTLWSFKSMIIDFLDVPDSGYSVWDLPTGETKDYRLDTDSGAILNAIYGEMNFKQESLLDAIRRVAEFLGYDGYVYIDPTTNKARIKFVQIGTLAGSPAKTFEEPFLSLRLSGSMRDVKNYILVKGGADAGIPHEGDRLSERAIAKFNATNPAWQAIDPDTSLADVTSPVKKGRYSIQFAKSVEGTEWCSAKLVLANAGYSPLNFKTRLRGIAFFLYPNCTNLQSNWGIDILVALIDSLGRKIWLTSQTLCNNNEWNLVKIKTPHIIFSEAEARIQEWWGDLDIDLSSISEVEFYFFQRWRKAAPPVVVSGWGAAGIGTALGNFYIDGLMFFGGKEIVPDSLNPPLEDSVSQGKYGVSTHWHIDQDINSFDMAQYEGQRLLNVLKDAVETVNFSMRSVTWLRPNQTVTLNLPRFGISNETWRVLEINYSYSPASRIICGFSLTKQTAPSPPPFAPTRGEVPPPIPPFETPDWWRYVF